MVKEICSDVWFEFSKSNFRWLSFQDKRFYGKILAYLFFSRLAEFFRRKMNQLKRGKNKKKKFFLTKKRQVSPNFLFILLFLLKASIYKFIITKFSSIGFFNEADTLESCSILIYYFVHTLSLPDWSLDFTKVNNISWI